MMKIDVSSCSIKNWYKIFENITIPSIILPIPYKVLNYLQENGTIVLPEGSCGNLIEEDADNELWKEDSSENIAIAPNFDDFNYNIRTAIRDLGGTVFPKLNWSSPKDAAWISFNKSLQCSNPGDVYLLLKSSDFVCHDLTQPFKDCVDRHVVAGKVDYFLALRKWVEINPSDEFRCFVKDKELIGISQRDVSQHYSIIHKEKDCIITDIIIFWEENIRNYFPLFSYVFDVHRPRDGQVTLIDFGPFGPTSDSLLFSWEELQSETQVGLQSQQGIDSNRISEEVEEEDIEPDFRYITNATGVQPSPYMRYGLPVDIVDLSTGQDPQKLTDFLKMKIQSQGGDESSSDEDDREDEESSVSSLSSSSV